MGDCYENTESSRSLFPQSPSPKCPTCGFTARQANVYRKGELWSTCHDPWHGVVSGSTDGADR